MKTAAYLFGVSVLLIAIFIESAKSTCVLESDFGFKINCAFKKSGLFRVRNLGGVKAHASIGFSLGDELGFEQSLTNLDTSRRRSVNLKNGAIPNFIADNTSHNDKQEKRGKLNRIMMNPMAPPIGPNQVAMDRLTTLHRRGTSTSSPIVVSDPISKGPTTLYKVNPIITIIKPVPSDTIPPFKPLPPKELSHKVLSMPVLTRKEYSQLQSPQSNDLGLRLQKPVSHQVHELAQSQHPVYNTKKVDDYNSITGYDDDQITKFHKDDINEKIMEIAKAGNITMEAVEAAIALRQQQLLNKYANVPRPITSTTTRSITEEPLILKNIAEPEIIATTQKHQRPPPLGHKVMNAPREYYPVGYEKNFDDHFQSKVELPDTNFQCGDQKYFPGLYGDESLGCMVFHVCAITDEGLVMKSFLCPESTLFDQTIIKCNWWFYVDCKNTGRLYDTNIPVSKSYQLMKALTFFSAYNKEVQDDDPATNPEDVEGIKDAISILENQDTKPPHSGNVVGSLQIITPRTYPGNTFDKNEPQPVYRGTTNYHSNSSITRK